MTEIKNTHTADFKNIQEQVSFFYSQKRKVKIYHGSTNTTRSVEFEKEKFIDASSLNKVIEINANEKFVLVEPNVSMDKLVEETLKHGLVPPVVPEFSGITIGGAVQGGAEESSSFKYGMVHDCCLEYEMIIGNGEAITASPQGNADLFWGTAASYGSLGVITLIKLRLIPAKDFIHLAYYTVRSFAEAVGFMKQKSGEAVGFIDAIMFSKNFGVVMIGDFASKNRLPITTFSKANDEWFYLHAKKISKKFEKYEELIPIRDYLFRYDKGAFWMGRYGFDIFKIPFTRLTRFILNGFCGTRTFYRLFHETNISQRYFIQDFNLPSKNTLEFLEFFDKELQIYPLWICPLKPGSEDKLSANYIKTDLVFNVGVWGGVKKDFPGFVKLNQDFEKKSVELGGRKMLYAHSYFPFDDFWKVYDLKWYNELRDKYNANDIFSTVYEKTLVRGKYKPSIFFGIWKYLKSSFSALCS